MKAKETFMIALGLASSAMLAQAQTSTGPDTSNQYQGQAQPAPPTPASGATAPTYPQQQVTPQPGATTQQQATPPAGDTSQQQLQQQPVTPMGTPPDQQTAPTTGNAPQQQGTPSTEISPQQQVAPSQGISPQQQVTPSTGMTPMQPAPAPSMETAPAPQQQQQQQQQLAPSSSGSSGSSTPPPAASATDSAAAPPVPQPKTENDVTYLCGGVGLDEAQMMKSEARNYDLMLTFAARDGSYLADVNVDIADARGALVLKTTCDGPILLVDLPKSGNYRIRSETAGHVVSRTAYVQNKKGAAKSLALVWPQFSTTSSTGSSSPN